MTTKRLDPIEELRPLPVAPFANLSEQLGTEAPLAYDVYRLDDDLCIDVDVPGVDPSAIQLSLENQYLTISASRELPAADIEVIERGRVHGTFERRLAFPGHWEVEGLRASVENGVLHLRAPMRASHRARTIPVEAVGSPGASPRHATEAAEAIERAPASAGT